MLAVTYTAQILYIGPYRHLLQSISSLPMVVSLHAKIQCYYNKGINKGEFLRKSQALASTRYFIDNPVKSAPILCMHLHKFFKFRKNVANYIFHWPLLVQLGACTYTHTLTYILACMHAFCADRPPNTSSPPSHKNSHHNVYILFDQRTRFDRFVHAIDIALWFNAPQAPWLSSS